MGLSQRLLRAFCFLAATSLIVGCAPEVQEPQPSTLEPEPPAAVAALMNPFTLKYGSVVQLPPESPPRPESWPRGSTDRFAVPLAPAAELPMFSDFDMTVIQPDGIIYASTAKRAYASLTGCVRAQRELLPIVQRNFPNLVETEYGKENGELVIDIGCTRHPGSRFILLELDIYHKESKCLIDVPDEFKAEFGC